MEDLDKKITWRDRYGRRWEWSSMSDNWRIYDGAASFTGNMPHQESEPFTIWSNDDLADLRAASDAAKRRHPNRLPRGSRSTSQVLDEAARVIEVYAPKFGALVSDCRTHATRLRDGE